MAWRFLLKWRLNGPSFMCKRNCIVSRRISIDGRYFELGTAEDVKLSKPVQLARRKYLPGSFIPGFPEHLSSPKDGFPHILKVIKNGDSKSVEFWSHCCRDHISSLYEDFKVGNSGPVAVLFRGLPIKTTRDFSLFMRGLKCEPFLYQGGAGLRDKVDEFVLTGAGEPDEFTVELHNDMAYSIDYPSKFVITCLKKSTFGGETAICNGRELSGNIDRDVIERFERKGIRYWRYYPDESEASYNSWQRSLMTEERIEAERFLASAGYSFQCDGKNLIYWNDGPPTVTHPLNGEKIWFNQAFIAHATFYKAMRMYERSDLPDEKYPSHTTYADGDPIDLDDLHKLRCSAWRTAVGVSLEESDVLFMDNIAVLHSRMSFRGDRLV